MERKINDLMIVFSDNDYYQLFYLIIHTLKKSCVDYGLMPDKKLITAIINGMIPSYYLLFQPYIQDLEAESSIQDAFHHTYEYLKLNEGKIFINDEVYDKLCEYDFTYKGEVYFDNNSESVYFLNAYNDSKIQII